MRKYLFLMYKYFVFLLIYMLLEVDGNAQTVSLKMTDKIRLLQQEIYDSFAKNNKKVDSQLNDVLHLYEQCYTVNSKQYADCVMWCSMVCAECGDFVQAEELLGQSIVLFRHHGIGPYEGRDTINEILRLDIEKSLNYNAKRDFVALKCAKAACKLKREFLGQHSEVYLNALLDISRLYAERLNYRKSNRYHNMGFDAYVERIKQEFCSRSESERTLYWEKAISYINKTTALAHKAGRKSQRGGENSLASAAYNAMLLSKGLLLNTSIGFENYINKSGNAEAMRNLQLKKLLSNQQAPQSSLDSLDYAILHALEEQGQRFELPHLSIGWKDVAAKLSEKDIAIEFYQTINGDYGAILLKRDWKSPKVVKLKDFVSTKTSFMPLEVAMSRISLEHYTKERADDLWRLSKAIWTDDIVRYFPEKGDGRVFFSADGELQMVGIEFLPFVKPLSNGVFYCISDLFPVYRLSSTRELVLERDNRDNHEAAVYGGLRYDMEYEDIVADARLHQSDAKVDLAYLSMGKERALREADAIDYLEGTKMEADSIVFTINNGASQMLHAVPYTGEKGTEISFKRLSNHHPRLIHVATHGYFYNEEDSTFNRFNLGNHPLVRSGLLFAGADYKWFGETLPAGIDDGFLTALEISNLDFRGLDLVVLSACETGKGSIKGDGVFGLQRGFKMASVNSILMSLWKVDDEATCLLMTEFYKHWIGEGKTKHDALEIAKQAVRSHKEKGWDKPKYWSAFILLDALD